MVVVDGIKYACERCIRGHRVSGCNHVDKPLTMIKKKGRPASQCNQCRKGKPGKPPRAAGALCSCGDTRRDRAVITPRDLRILQLEHGVKVELTDGSVVSPTESEFTDHSTSPPTAAPGTKIDSPLAHSPAQLYTSTGPGPPLGVALPNSANEDGLVAYDAMGSSSSYSVQESLGDGSNGALRSRLSVRYGPQDEFLNVPAFRYEAGFLGQPYNADLYNSASGNNAAAAEANAGGESTAAVANVSRGRNGPFTGILSLDSDVPGVRRRVSLTPVSTTHHSLLSTSSQDLEASLSALGPLVGGPTSDIDREELVGGILRSSPQTSPTIATKKHELTGEMLKKEETTDPYSSVQPMPELSSLY